MRSRLASASAQIVLARPTFTCVITACGRPVTAVNPCAMQTAAFSCGITIGFGTFRLDRAARAKASMIGAKSVPGLTNR